MLKWLYGKPLLFYDVFILAFFTSIFYDVYVDEVNGFTWGFAAAALYYMYRKNSLARKLELLEKFNDSEDE